MGASAFGSISALAATPPSPSSVEPSFLYADLQSRSLWLGVDPAVNPLGSVLIADIVQTQADIIAAEVNAKLYTDAQVLLRAPLVHGHTAADIVDFDAAVDAAIADNTDIQWITGMILLWSGALSSIGVGTLAGWALCDGSNGTPDLRDRFIIGAGNKLPGTKNVLGTFTTDLQGVHAHTIAGHAITLAQMAAHNHYGEVGAPGAAHRAYGATYTDAPHAHTSYGPWRTGPSSGLNHDNSIESDSPVHESVRTGTTGTDGHHNHSVYVDIHAGVTVNSKGSGHTHTHGCESAGGHEHTISSQQIRDNAPYYALAYIMKL